MYLCSKNKGPDQLHIYHAIDGSGTPRPEIISARDSSARTFRPIFQSGTARPTLVGPLGPFFNFYYILFYFICLGGGGGGGGGGGAMYCYAPNFEKVDGAYCFWSMRGWVRACVTLFVPTVTFKPLKLES